MNTHIPRQRNTDTKHNPLVQKILDRIDHERVAPSPRWRFRVRNYTMWALWALTVIVGAVAVSILLYVSAHIGFSLYEATHPTWLSFLVDMLPYLWIFVFALMTFLAYWNYRCTKCGYRYSLWQVLTSSIAFSILGGAMLYMFGFAHQIDSQLGESMPMYPSLEDVEERLWQNPEEGRMLGVYVSPLAEDDHVTFRDLRDRRWTLNTVFLMQSDLETLFSGTRVRVLGVVATSSGLYFYGCGVFPWVYDQDMSIADMRDDRESFIDRMREYIDNDTAFEQLEDLEEQVFTDQLAAESMGICAKHEAVRRMGERMR